MKNFLTLDTLDAAGKVILLRADLNVPVKNNQVTDATRINRLVPTLQELSTAGAKTVILSHFGRPRGKDPVFSLQQIIKPLSTALGKPVSFAPDCLGLAATDAIGNMQNGDILLLENVRFYPEEEKNNTAFAQELAQLGDVYVNDAFSCAHRAHASTEGLARHLPAYAGRLMEAELTALETALEKPQHPVVAIVGGAKISTKLDLLNNLVQKIDILVLGGGMANTFLAALDHPVGKSLCEHDMKDQARKIMQTADENACRIMLPTDAITAKEFKANPATETRHVDDIKDDDMMLDIGPESVALIEAMLGKARTVLWNGPVGAFETTPFDQGTVKLAEIVAQLTQTGQIISVAGGGDTVAALAHAGVEGKMTYVSTAGGAFLEWLEGKTLPGVQILFDRAAVLRTASPASASAGA